MTQLASSAQRTFAFAAPGGGRGHHDRRAGKHAEGGRHREGTREQDQRRLVRHRVRGRRGHRNGGALQRRMGASGGDFITVSDPGGVLTETGAAKEGSDAEYTIDGVAGTSASNTLTGAIPGVTLNLKALTRGAGDGQRAAAGSEHECDRRAGAVVRQALQLGGGRSRTSSRPSLRLRRRRPPNCRLGRCSATSSSRTWSRACASRSMRREKNYRRKCRASRTSASARARERARAPSQAAVQAS